jgi:predicted lipid carrier protein YhbT
VRRAPDGLVVTQEHGKGDVAARGGASDLLLFLWGRAGLDALEVFGDKALLEDWQERARF